MLILVQKMREEIPVFDFYSECTQHARLVASQHPETPSTWPEISRQAHEADMDTRPYSGASEKPVLFVLYRFLSAWTARRLYRRQRPAKRQVVHSQGLPVKKDSPVSR